MTTKYSRWMNKGTAEIIRVEGSDKLKIHRGKYEELPKNEWYMSDSKKGEEIKVLLNRETCFKYNLIPMYSEIRSKFPGYRVNFNIKEGNDVFTTYVTSALRGTKVGEMKGSFISTGIKNLYKNNPQIKKDGFIVLKVISPGRVYQVII